jgi:7-carboxy-7-deazaguanine synthase
MIPLLTKPTNPPYGLQAHRDTIALPPVGTLTVQEVFSSVQGEGPHVGVRQVFIRLAHCHLKCAYCDTTMTSPDGQATVEHPAGSGQWHRQPNPLTVDQVVTAVHQVMGGVPHHSVSLTGGEPLLYADTLTGLLPALQALGLKTYLETSGTQPLALEKVLPWVDVLAMDVKLPSTTGEPWRSQQHRAFFELAHSNSSIETFIKLIVSDATTLDEVALLPEMILDANTPVFLQPETALTAPFGLKASPEHLLALQAELLCHYHQVRIIPQTHKWLNVS